MRRDEPSQPGGGTSPGPTSMSTWMSTRLSIAAGGPGRRRPAPSRVDRLPNEPKVLARLVGGGEVLIDNPVAAPEHLANVASVELGNYSSNLRVLAEVVLGRDQLTNRESGMVLGILSDLGEDRGQAVASLRCPPDGGHWLKRLTISSWDRSFPASASLRPCSTFATNTRRSIASSMVASAGSVATASRIRCLSWGELGDWSRRLQYSPTATPPELVRALLEARHRHPTWGARMVNGRAIMPGSRGRGRSHSTAMRLSLPAGATKPVWRTHSEVNANRAGPGSCRLTFTELATRRAER